MHRKSDEPLLSELFHEAHPAVERVPGVRLNNGGLESPLLRVDRYWPGVGKMDFGRKSPDVATPGLRPRSTIDRRGLWN